MLIGDAIAEATRVRPVTSEPVCFVAGTLVHTKEGLVPIERLRVGDWVLSQPEQKGERADKRVVKTFEFEDQEVVAVDYLMDGKPGGFVVTGKHPFWVQNVGWTPAEHLQGGEILELADGSTCKVFNQSPLERTTENGVAWMEGMIHSTRGDGFGRTVDMRHGTPRFNYKSVPNDVTESEFGLYRTKVYNIEVEDYHTYYVGDIGAWVHNTKTGHVGVQLVDAAVGLRPSPNTPFYTIPGKEQFALKLEVLERSTARGRLTAFAGNQCLLRGALPLSPLSARVGLQAAH